MIFGQHAEKIKNKCLPASPELAMADRLPEPSTTSLLGALKETKTAYARPARKLKISVPAVSQSVIRGEKLAKAGKYPLIEYA